MRLLVSAQHFPPQVGGIESYTIELAKRLAPRCERLDLVAPKGPGARDIDASLPFAVHRVPSSKPWYLVTAVPTLTRRLRSGDYDAILCPHWSSAVPVLPTLRRWRGRSFLSVHGQELLLAPLAAAPPAQRAYDRIRRTILRRADRVFAVSRYTGELARASGVAAERICVVPNGTDPETYRPLDTDRCRAELGLSGGPVLLTVARLVPRKGVDTVIEALPGLVQRFAGLRYVVVGEGPERQALEERASRLGMRDHVQFVGRAAPGDLVRYYNACDVFVMPARPVGPSVEGFGLVFLEAGACGKPVVGSRCGGIVDAIVEGETGVLVEPGDGPALGSALGSLLSDPAKAARMGEAGRRRVLEEGTWDRVADRMWQAMTDAGA